jgi:hypothetical protein
MGYDGAVDLLQVKSFITSFSGSGLYIVERREDADAESSGDIQVV